MMQNVSWASHAYFDVSNLNAKWDQALPAVAGLGGVGNGVLSGNALAIRGLGQDPYLPWSEHSADTVAFQEELNSLLAQLWANEGKDVETECPASLLTADGKLGPKTCGLASYLAEDGWPVIVPGTCQSYAEPICVQASAPSNNTSSPAEPDVVELQEGTLVRRSPSWLLLGTGVAVIAIGAAMVMKKKRRG